VGQRLPAEVLEALAELREHAALAPEVVVEAAPRKREQVGRRKGLGMVDVQVRQEGELRVEDRAQGGPLRDGADFLFEPPDFAHDEGHVEAALHQSLEGTVAGLEGLADRAVEGFSHLGDGLVQGLDLLLLAGILPAEIAQECVAVVKEVDAVLRQDDLQGRVQRRDE